MSLDVRLRSAEKAVTAAGTRERLEVGERSGTRCKSVTIKALTSNAGKVYVGGSNVASTNGYDLDPGESVGISLDPRDVDDGVAVDLSEIYLDVDVSGEGVRYLVVVL